MGQGIAEVLASHGVDVVGVEVSEDAAARGLAAISRSTARAVARGKLTEEERAQTLSRIHTATTLSALADRDLVIEAVPENLELKRAVLAELDRILAPTAVIATNTASSAVTEISVSTGRPDRVVGLHFFNPAPVEAFVEIVRTVVSSAEVVATVKSFAEGLGRTPVVVGDGSGVRSRTWSPSTTARLFGGMSTPATSAASRSTFTKSSHRQPISRCFPQRKPSSPLTSEPPLRKPRKTSASKSPIR